MISKTLLRTKGSRVATFGAILCVVSTIAFLAWAGTRTVKWILFGINCEGRITRAAHANVVELAKEEMEVVVKYLEDNGHTTGYTSILYQTPDEDVGFWYTNLKDALLELRHVKPDATQLEKSNLLIKLRESLQTHGQNKAQVIVPSGITVHPHNLFYAVWACGSALMAVLGLILTCGVDKVLSSLP